jgi:hypothetical protein
MTQLNDRPFSSGARLSEGVTLQQDHHAFNVNSKVLEWIRTTHNREDGHSLPGVDCWGHSTPEQFSTILTRPSRYYLLSEVAQQYLFIQNDQGSFPIFSMFPSYFCPYLMLFICCSFF